MSDITSLKQKLNAAGVRGSTTTTSAATSTRKTNKRSKKNGTWLPEEDYQRFKQVKKATGNLIKSGNMQSNSAVDQLLGTRRGQNGTRMPGRSTITNQLKGGIAPKQYSEPARLITKRLDPVLREDGIGYDVSQLQRAGEIPYQSKPVGRKPGSSAYEQATEKVRQMKEQQNNERTAAGNSKSAFNDWLAGASANRNAGDTLKTELTPKPQTANTNPALGGRSYLEANMAQQWNDPNSNFWKWARQDQQQKQEAARPITQDYDMGTWGKYGKDAYEATLIGNIPESSQAMRELIDSGYFNGSGDYNLMSTSALQTEKKRLIGAKQTTQLEIDKLQEQQLNESQGHAFMNEDMPEYQSVIGLYRSPEAENERKILNGSGYSDEQKGIAQNTLYDLYDEYNDYGETARDRTEFILTDGAHIREMMDANDHEGARRYVYDYMNESGAYDQAMESLDEEGRRALNNDIDRGISAILMYGNNTESKLATAQSRLEYADDQLGMVDRTLSRREEYGDLFTTGGVGDTEYDPALDTYRWTVDDRGGYDGPANAERVYSLINGTYPEEMKQERFVNSEKYNALLMSPEEKDEFMRLYKAGKKEEAYAFYQALQPTLNSYGTYYEQLGLRMDATALPITSSAGSLLMTALQPGEFLAGQGARLLGDRSASDPYSSLYRGTRSKQSLRGYVGQNIEEAYGSEARQLYDSQMSNFDNVVNAALFGKLPFGRAATLGAFFSQSYQTSFVNNMKETNGDEMTSRVGAFLDAFIETGTEIASIEALLSDPTNFAAYMAKNIVSEGSEEVEGAMLGPILKQVLTGKNEWRTRANEILAQGTYTDKDGNTIDVKDYDTAWRLAAKEWNHDIVMSGVGGALSMLGPAAYGGARNLYGRYQTGQLGKNVRNYQQGNMNLNNGIRGPQIQANETQTQQDVINSPQLNAEAETEGQAQKQAQRISEATNEEKQMSGTELLLDAAGKLSEDSQSAKLAERIREDQKYGRKTSNYRLGELAMTIAQESRGEMSEIAKGVIADSATAEMVAKGMKQGQSWVLGQSIAKALTSEEGLDALTKEERQKLESSPRAMDVYNQLLKGTNAENNKAINDLIGKKSRAQVEAYEAVAEAAKGAKGKNVSYFMRQDADPGEQYAKEEDIEEVGQPATRSGDEVILDGAYGKITGVQYNRETKQNEYIVEQDGQKKTVSAADFKATNFTTAAVIRQAEVNGGVFSARYVNKIMQQTQKGDVTDVGSFMMDAMRIRYAAWAGVDMPETNLPKSVAFELYQDSILEHKDMMENPEAYGIEQRQKNALGRGKGVLYFRGVQYGEEAWGGLMQDETLSQADREQIELAARFAKEAGMRVTVYEDEGDIEEYGSENAEGIRLNLRGMNMARVNGEKKATGKHSIIISFGHEGTHWLRRNAPEAYMRLERHVMESLQKQGVNVGLAVQKMYEARRQYEPNITLDDAIEEIVADASDQLFTNEKAAQYIQEHDQKLAGKIREFVKDLVERVKRVLKYTKGSESFYSRKMGQYANELHRIWLGGLDEVLSEAAQESEPQQESVTAEGLRKDLEMSDGTETHYGDNARMSRLVTDEEELEFLNNQKTIKTYKSMQLIDGKLYPPMAAVVAGNMEDASELGKWEKATEHPELIKGGNKFTLNKGKGKGSLDAAYNPYMHSSNLMINDQFSGAWNRPNLVTVECEVPSSELDSGYHAEFAKDSVGWHSWHTGPVASLIRNQKGTERQVFLSRWIKPVRIVENAEVAQHYAELLEGTDIAIPDNVVTPALREELEKAGVPIKETGRVRNSRAALDQQNEKITVDTEGKQLTEGQQKFFRDSKAVDENGRLVKLYHGTTSAGFTEFIDTDDIGYFFTDSAEVARTYSDTYREFTPKRANNWDDVNEYAEGIGYRFELQDDGLYHWIDNDTEEDIANFRDYEYQAAMEEMDAEWVMQNGTKANYPVYLNITNPLIIEGNGSTWNSVIDTQGRELQEWDDLTDEEKQAISDNTGLSLEELEAMSVDDYGIDMPIYDTENNAVAAYQKTRDWVTEAADMGYDGVIFRDIVDEGQYGNGYMPSNVYVAMKANQVKLANNENPTKKSDLRYSRSIVDRAEESGIDLDLNNQTASRFSRASFMRSEYFKNPDEMARMLARNVLGKETRANVAKAKKWIKDVTSISAMIGERPDLLDYVASPGRSSFKSNPEYGGSIDSSTICAKRRLQTGTIDAIQRAMPDYVMTAEDFLQVRRMMKERGYEVSCGLCFVESSRKNIAKYASQFMKEWNSQHPENQVDMKQINTVLGLEDTRINNKEVYEAYEKFMNKLAQRKPKLFEMRSEYDNDIMKHFRNDESIREKNKNGGMRINSFSDFEIVHLIDMMQVIMDMGNVGLAGQAYTKVREFAEALGPTGLKINMSMIAAGVDADGRIIFDETEGMKWSDVKDLRDKYADNVGTICVVFTEEQLMASMADDRIDFIIPFHRSQWNKSNYKDIGLPEDAKDFTYWQNERYRTPVYGTKKDGTPKKLRASNYMPNEYWDFKKSGKENAQNYLKMCAENNKIPKFWKWLQNNGDGTFSLKEDGSTDGYWKLLIDFKMYNHITGEGAEQMPVRPEFDMEASRRMLQEYQGGHATFPEATDVVRDFVDEKKNGKKGINRKGGRIQLAANETARMSRASEENMEVNSWMAGIDVTKLQNEDERQLVQAYRGIQTTLDLSRKKIRDYNAKLKILEEAQVKGLTREEQKDMENLIFRIEEEKKKMAKLEDRLYEVTSDSGFGGLMYRHAKMVENYISGKTQEQVVEAVESIQTEVKDIRKLMEKRKGELEKLSEQAGVKAMKSMVNKTQLKSVADDLTEMIGTGVGRAELNARLAEMAIKAARGESIKEDARDLAEAMMDNSRDFRSEVLEPLRGYTLVLGPEDMKLLKYHGQNLNDVKKALRGTGIKVTSGALSNIETQIDEAFDMNESMKERLMEGGEPIANLQDILAAEREQSMDQDRAGMNPGQWTDLIEGCARAIGVEMKEDTAAAAEARKILKELKGTEDVLARIEQVESKGRAAKAWARSVQLDTDSAVNYFNKVAQAAALESRRKVKEEVIANLKSDHAKALVAQAQKYEEQIKKDKKMRELRADNEHVRKQIDTVVKRVNKLLSAETDVKNIPEEAKPLARQLVQMILQNDLTGGIPITYGSRKQRTEAMEFLKMLESTDGIFDMDTSLEWLVRGEGENRDESAKEAVQEDLEMIETGLLNLNRSQGQGAVTLQDRNEALQLIRESVSEIWSVIRHSQEVEVNGRRMIVGELANDVARDAANSRFKGEWRNKGLQFGRKAVIYGNMTPEYFFKNLKNAAMSLIHGEFHKAENANGLNLRKAQQKLEKIAADAGYSSWDMESKITLPLDSGEEVKLTRGQLMSLWATWKREKLNQQNRENGEPSYHLTTGGFYIEEKSEGKGAREQLVKPKAHRMTEADATRIEAMLTDAQRDFVDRIVEYMSTDMSEIGNKASMRMYGIKKYKEKYYFPIKSWEGHLNTRIESVGNQGDLVNRQANQGFTKRRMRKASNAIEIGDFVEVATNHIVSMINYSTFAPSIEIMDKVMNQNIDTGEGVTANHAKLLTVFGQVYGKDAKKYLGQFMKDLNGGVLADRTAYDKLLSVFRKGAVAGSLSVAIQQPLSYIRAAMVINPKYLAEAINPKYWAGSHEEMLNHSGVAVIKEMGRFDMGFGETAKEFIAPEKQEKKLKKVWNKTTELATILPEKMDTMTWTRMWSACKIEQHELHPEMDITSDAFLDMVGERFNEVMRRTQVYDSVLVRSQNMRSKNPFMKSITSFMAEPSLTLNVLYDAAINAKEKGGMANLATAGATFVMSAAAQAVFKALVATGRTPDKKKNWWENFNYRFWYNFINEIDPLKMIPGFGDLMEVLKNGELQDDAMGVFGKLSKAFDSFLKLVTGDGDFYRNFEDSIGQFFQIFTNLPMKNLMRDGRAIYNWFNPDTYADHETSAAVLKNQWTDLMLTADNLIGLVNSKLVKSGKGYDTGNKAYYQRIYDAKKAGNTQAAQEMTEYLTTGRGLKEKTVTQEVTKLARDDENASAAETAEFLLGEGGNVRDYTLDQYKEGEISRDEAARILKQNNPEMTDDDIFWTLDRADFKKETGAEEVSGKNYRFYDAIENGGSAEIRKAAAFLKEHGVDLKKQRGSLTTRYKKKYLELKPASAEQVKMKNQLIMAYKETGMTEQEAEQLINKWKKDSGGIPQGAAVVGSNGLRPSGLRNRLETDSGDNKDTTGRYGKGTIDLNNRQVVQNRDGSISTERSFSFYDEDTGKEVLIPTVVGGRILTEDEAIEHYYDTVRAGKPEYLGMFDTPEEATEYAERLHNRQDWYYHNH